MRGDGARQIWVSGKGARCSWDRLSRTRKRWFRQFLRGYPVAMVGLDELNAEGLIQGWIQPVLTDAGEGVAAYLAMQRLRNPAPTGEA